MMKGSDASDLVMIPSVELRTDPLRSRLLRDPSPQTLGSQRNRTKKLAAARLQELTINKLKIQSVGLVGREKETNVLRKRLQSVIQQAGAMNIEFSVFKDSSDSGLQISKSNKEVVFIQGFSGVGKTSLARAIQQEVNSTKNGFFAEGKFDLSDAKDEPYSGIARAYGDLIRELKRTDRNMLLGVGQKLCKMFGTEVDPLTYLIPELEDILPEYSAATYSDGSSTMEGMQERWKYSFRVLTRLLTAHVKPLVLVLDDLQWADKGSLGLIEALVTDSQNINPLMVIGCYRSNEADDNNELSSLIRSLTGEKNKYGVHITEIVLEALGSREVNQMVMKMLDSDDEERTADLAELCFQRTLGNPFFVIEFMSMLHREELIDFNIGTMKWLYNVAKIEDATMATANVVQLLQFRMQRMPAEVQLLLSIAACLGPSFRVSILDMVWRNSVYVESKGLSDAKLLELIDFVQVEMLIEPGPGESFRWVHDKVQEAAFSIVDADKDELRFEMGKILYLNLMGKELDDELFDVADLISSGIDEKSADFASLFLKAALKARRMSAFFSATKYIQVGIRMLPDDHWCTHQSLTLELYAVGAQVELELGNVPETKKYCSTVVCRDDVDMDSKIPLRVVETRRLGQVEMDHSNAIKSGLTLLKDMGFKFRWNRTLAPIQAITMLRGTVKALKQQPKDFYLQLGKMDDRNRIITEVLNLLMEALMYSGVMTQAILCSCHIVQLTLKHGLSEYSAAHFGTLGSLAVLVFQMHKDAPWFREVALSTQNQYGRSMIALTTYTTYSYSLGWSLRLDSLKHSFYGWYLQGMQNGEVANSMWHLFSHCATIPFILGKPIDQTLEVCPAATLQMDDVSQAMQGRLMKCFWQMNVILQDPSKVKDPCVLRGAVHSIDGCVEGPRILAYHGFAEFQLLLFYDDASAADRAIEIASKEKGNAGYIRGMIEIFHRGVSFYIAARRTKKRKYKQHAKKIRAKIKKWKEQGNPNVVYYCTFLDAEQAALEGKRDEAETHYKNAIQFVAKGGYLHHAALFNERYSDFLLRERNDVEEAKYRLEEAIRYYQDWGAFGVVERLKKSSLLQ